MILSSALFNNYFPLLVVANYVLTPLPNAICGSCATNDDSLFGGEGESGLVDFGRFLTGFFVVMGIGEFGQVSIDFVFWRDARAAHVKGERLLMFLGNWVALPAVLAHSHIIQIPAMIMSVLGGLLIYGTIITFTMFFAEERDDVGY